MRRYVCLLLMVLWCLPAVAVDNEPVHTLPAQNATFMPDLQTYLKRELASILMRLSPVGRVVSGGLPATSGSCTSPAFATEAVTNQGNRVTANGSGGAVAINFGTQGANCSNPGSAVVRTVICAASANTLGNFHRVGTTSNYFTNVIDTDPQTPADCATLFDVGITNGIITTVHDKRDLSWTSARTRQFNVLDYGAVADDATDLGVPLTAALRACAEQHGGIVHVPVGVYRQTSAVVIPGGCTVQGDGWEADTGFLSGVHGKGTWIHLTSTSFVPFTLVNVAPAIKGIAFDHDQPAPGVGWAPNAYPYTIEFTEPGGDAVIEDILFWRATKGIREYSSTNQGYARYSIRRILGQIFDTGVEIGFNADVGRMADIHFWPFWSLDTNVTAYQTSHAVGIRSLRNDNPHFESIFIFGMDWGFFFGSNSYGVTNKFRIVNADLDHVRVGIEVNGDATTGQLSNVTTQGDTLDPGLGVTLTGNAAHVEASNLSVGAVTTSCVAVQNSSVFLITNLRCDNWNLLSGGFPAMEGATNGKFILGGTRAFTNGHSGAFYSSVDAFFPATMPGGAFFNPGETLFVGMNTDGNPVVKFDQNANIGRNIPDGKISIHNGTDFQTSGSYRYLCVKDEEVYARTSCP
jgi:Pectate lyase superfamily protein